MAAVDAFSLYRATIADIVIMAVSGYRHNTHDKRSRQELIEEIARLKEKLKAKDGEIAILNKRVALYKTLK